MFRDSQKEKWKERLLETEVKRNELLPERQRMQKRYQKMQSIQDKKRNLLKEAGACEEEMRKVGEEINKERRAICSCRTSRPTIGWQQKIWKKSRGACRQGCKEVAVPRKPMTAASVQWWSSSSLWERHMRDDNSKLCRRTSSEDSRSQPHLHKCQEESGKRSKRKEKPDIRAKWVHPRQLGAMEAFQRVLFLILLGSRVQKAKAVEQEISIHRTIEARSLSHSPRKEQQQMQEDGRL